MGTYIREKSPCFRKEFKEWINENFPKFSRVNNNIIKIKDFCKINNRRPSFSFKNLDERKLAITMNSYIQEKSFSFRKSLKEWLNENYPKINRVDKSIEEIKEFCLKNNRRPKLTCKDLHEKKLASKMKNYIYNKYKNQSKIAFKQWLDKNYPSNIQNKKVK